MEGGENLVNYHLSQEVNRFKVKLPPIKQNNAVRGGREGWYPELKKPAEKEETKPLKGRNRTASWAWQGPGKRDNLPVSSMDLEDQMQCLNDREAMNVTPSYAICPPN